MNSKQKEKISFWLYLAPSLIAFGLVVLIPFFVGLYYSFTDWSAIPGAEIHFIGLQNYKDVFRDGQFFTSFRLTIIYSLYAVILINVIGFALAILVTRKMRTANLLRTTFFMPNLIGGLILGYIWKFAFLKIIPIIFQSDSSMLSTPNKALLAMAIVSTWQMGGYIMVIYVAAIQGIPAELIEASQIDGANAWERIKSIVFPMVAPAFTVSLFLTLSNSFKMFDVNVSLTNGDPARGTELLALEIYNKAFVEANFGQGQAQAVIFFVLIAVVTLTQVYFTKRREVEL